MGGGGGSWNCELGSGVGEVVMEIYGFSCKVWVRLNVDSR